MFVVKVAVFNLPPFTSAATALVHSSCVKHAALKA
jgi:hypothetical protein